MSGKETEEKSSILNFKTFQVIIGIIFATGSFYFTVVKYIQSQPKVDVYVNSFDILFEGETDLEPLIYKLNNIEDKYVDVTGLWIIDLIDYFDSTSTDISLNTINHKVDEIIDHYSRLLGVMDTYIKYGSDYAYLTIDDYIEVYYDELPYLYPNEFDSLELDTLEDAYFESSYLDSTMNERLESLAHSYLRSEIESMIDDLKKMQSEYGLYIDPKDSYLEIGLTFVNRSSNSNAILPDFYMLVSDNFENEDSDNFYSFRLDLKRTNEIKPLNITTVRARSELINNTIGDFDMTKDDENGSDVEPSDIMDIEFYEYRSEGGSEESRVHEMNERFRYFFELIAKTDESQEFNNFKVGIRDIHNNIWWDSGNIRRIGESESEREFVSAARKGSLLSILK